MNEIPSGSHVHHIVFHSPLGWVLVASSSKGICLLQFLGPEKPSQRELDRILGQEHRGAPPAGADSPLLHTARSALLEYFAHGAPLPNLPLDLLAGTSFQKAVWQALSQIPHGETRTYAQVALALGRPGASRAVGQACGRNPVAVLVPCHRVVASNGGLGGYSGGLHIKQFLLTLEKPRRSDHAPRKADP